VAAVAVGATVLGGGAIGATAARTEIGPTARSSSLLASARSSVESLAELIGIEDDDAAASGTLDDGEELLPQASISLERAVAAAQGAASGSLGEVDLEFFAGALVFNVDVGDKDVNVDAATGDVLGVVADD
jgi:uncharacterized membrane protein YkoI